MSGAKLGRPESAISTALPLAVSLRDIGKSVSLRQQITVLADVHYHVKLCDSLTTDQCFSITGIFIQFK